MTRISYKRHRFPATVIQHALWLYFRFTLSLRYVNELIAQRGIDVSYETIRAWAAKFGPKIAANLRRRKKPPSPHWHLDEMVPVGTGKLSPKRRNSACREISRRVKSYENSKEPMTDFC